MIRGGSGADGHDGSRCIRAPRAYFDDCLGALTGTVKWTGPVPKIAAITINKDPEICDPQSLKKRDLERLLVGPNGGVANTVVFLKNDNLPFPFANQTVSRTMNRTGLVKLRCNAGHVWMNAEMLVVPHPYYAVTDEDGNFRLTDVPPGEYEIEAWHEGWKVVGQGERYDVNQADAGAAPGVFRSDGMDEESYPAGGRNGQLAS